MEKTYNPSSIEQTTYQQWEKSNYFAPDFSKSPTYCIMQPPPNVTGSLHMGHGFQLTLMDILIRYHRMSGYATLWQGGTDHAGISTQMVVERQLLTKGVTRHELGREKFLEKVWDWKAESGNNIMQQIRRLGCSLDWSRARFTMDDELSAAVNKAFITLYDEGLIYRGKRLVNWDPKLCTAISDLEVLSEEEPGQLWHIRYPLVSGDGYIVVATTRPETLLGDAAVAVNPNDERYQHLIGQFIKLPLTDREIPIIADDYVDPEFGSGCVKITPAHDFNDYAVGQRHNLPLINIFTLQAHLNDQVPAVYQGLERFTAREKILADLQALNLIDKIKAHTLKVPRGDRTGVVVEPLLTDQWYVKIAPLAEPAIAAVKNGDTQFVPENWSKTYFQWMDNIQDWCISRQLWWGHRIPAWHDAQGNIYVAEDEASVRKKYNLPADLLLQQDEDVLDTWFSSALWPFSTLHWPQNTKELNLFYPTNVLVTGFDIIFFWVARMMMFGLKFMGKVPFEKVYITGLVRDAEGQKMSKTKGNVLDPIDLIDGIELEQLIAKRTYGLMQPAMEKRIAETTRKQFPNGIAAYGTDALRFTFCAIANNNRNIRFDVSRLEGYRNFCNKLWNAARYVLMNVENKDCRLKDNTPFSLADRWILSLLQQTIQKAQQDIEHYRFDFLAQTLYEFTWHEYCDWYLELSKTILNNEEISEEIKVGTRHTLIHVLETILRLLHPIIPFITESIWQELAPLANIHADSIMLQNYPIADKNKIDDDAEKNIAWVKNVILGVRNIRGEMNISPAKKLPLYFHQGNNSDKKLSQETAIYLMLLAKLESINWLENQEKPPAATALVGELELLVPLAGLIDKEAEISRLNKEIEKISKEITKCQQKLNNDSFVAKAPADVVEQERTRLAEMQIALQKLAEQKEKMEDM